ncbi:MAG: hypothetical protein K2Q26_05265 [Bdellovibrionales bacterium]|nr:hypothetical protein [Bdellovibrionales bacterium]
MKFIYLIPVVLLAVACGKNGNDPIDQTTLASTTDEILSEAEESDLHVLSPEQEEAFEQEQLENEIVGKAYKYKFPQTIWKECLDDVTGNYSGYKCANTRKISQILKTFMMTHMHKCVNRGLAAQGGGKMADYHIVHAGITGDPRHSPKSLHAENRAIDIKSMEVKLVGGKVKNFVFAGSANTAYFNAFRKCWSETLRDFNKCPNVKNAGTIGKEDKNHKNHLHTSVPYCISGKYGAGWFQK